MTETDSSALTTRYNPDGYQETNRAIGGIVSYSSQTSFHPAWTINDGRRGAPYITGLNDYTYWVSNRAPNDYGCDYNNWWVSVKFVGAPGTICPAGGCAYPISEIALFSLQDDYWTGAEPTRTTVTTNFGNIHFQLQYCPAGVTCYPNGTGWVVAPDGYITWNDKAWRSISLSSPVQATAVRAQLQCSQDPWAYVVELEAWQRSTTAPACPGEDAANTVIPNDQGLLYVGNDNSTTTKLAESDRFWWKYFGPASDGSYGISDDDEAAEVEYVIATPEADIWRVGRRAQALAQMYDLLAPVDFPRALVYLERLRRLSQALLDNRDDKKLPQQYDPFHGQVMPAWGEVDPELDLDGDGDGEWTADITRAGLFTYPMAAFARRVADSPDSFCLTYRLDAIKFTTAVIETYSAFRQDMYFVDASPFAYYKFPASYGSLSCTNPSTYDNCLENKSSANYPQPWNRGLALPKSLMELASAADSALYRTSLDATAQRLSYATQEAPRFIAKYVNYFLDDLKTESLPDTTQWSWWDYRPYDVNGENGSWPEDLGHGQFTLRSIMTAWENKTVIDGLLQRYGYSERVGLTSTHLARISNTFVRRIWYTDYNSTTNWNVLRNSVSARECEDDYPGEDDDPNCTPSLDRGVNGNEDCAGYLPLAQVDPSVNPNGPWVWVRCRDSVFNPNVYPFTASNWAALREDNHAALLRYR